MGGGPPGPTADRGASTGVRNIALLGHTGSGKTTLAEALLFATGAITRQGRVEDGSTVSDFEPEEIKYRMSLSLALVPCTVGDVKLNMIDTPGFSDFFGEVRAACATVDLAVLVVSAVDGVEAQTEAAWALACELGLPRLVFVNKLDREQASFDRTLAQLKDHFGDGMVPLELPLNGESGFRGIADLLTDTAISYETGAPQAGPVPSDLVATEHAVREQLVEGIVVGDDDLMERYLDGDAPTSAELEGTLAAEVAEGTAFPVVCGSAATGVGIDRLASLLAEIAPAPESRPPVEVRAGSSVQKIPCDPGGQPLAHVFKTVSDPYVGKISLLRVLSGTIRPDTVLTNARTHGDDRLHVLYVLRGKEALATDEARAGDIVAVPKLADVVTGDTLAPKGAPVLVPPMPSEPVTLSVGISPRSKGDEDKMMIGLRRLQEEDPAVVVERVDETHQTILWGTGETHLARSVERLARKFGVEIAVEPVRIPYRETITRRSEAEGRYKKQTGGHGQFGVASVRIDPLARGEGFRFADQVVGGAIPRQYIPAVERGIVEAMGTGGIYGYPVVDVQATCLDGKHHAVDSSEMSFKMAGSLAFKEAMAKAASVLLEPLSFVEVTVPAVMQGQVLGDLNARRGRVQGTEALDAGLQRITALVPTAEIQRYAVDLRSLTAGRGRFRAEHAHYDVLPPNLVDKVVTARVR